MDHFYEGIKGWSKFLPLYKQVVEEAKVGARFVEVGCWKGRSAAYMAVEIANSGKLIWFDCVDHWQGSDEEAHKQDPDVKAGKLLEVFLKNIWPARTYIRIRQMSSVQAAMTYKDKTLDFVFLDASHDLESVRADLDAWIPKVKVGGIIAGDDWKWEGVHLAVLEKFDKEDVNVVVIERGTYWWMRLKG